MFDYHTNGDNLITRVNEAFVQFAQENWRADFQPEMVLGTSLFRHITDIATRHLYSLLMERVRATGRPISLPFRCDSPQVRRFMEMTISPDEGGGLGWSSRVLRLEPREPMGIMESMEEPGETCLLSVCSWCKRAAVPQWMTSPEAQVMHGQWVELEELTRVMGPDGACHFPHLTHTACPRCYQEVLHEINEYGHEA